VKIAANKVDNERMLLKVLLQSMSAFISDPSIKAVSGEHRIKQGDFIKTCKVDSRDNESRPENLV
jgi:hypothetical protein